MPKKTKVIHSTDDVIKKAASQLASKLKGKAVKLKRNPDYNLGWVGGDYEGDPADVVYGIGFKAGGEDLTVLIAGYELSGGEDYRYSRSLETPYWTGLYDGTPAEVERKSKAEAWDIDEDKQINVGSLFSFIQDMIKINMPDAKTGASASKNKLGIVKGATMGCQQQKQVIKAMLEAGRPDLANHVAKMTTAGAKLSSSLKSKINKDLIKAGLDGNGRFRKVGEAISVAAEVFQKHGLEEDDVFSADRLRGPDGRATFHMAFTNVEDPFSPEPISNSMLVVQWHFFEETSKYEVLMYLS